jgi:dipeptidase
MRKVFLSLIFILLSLIYSEASTNFIVGKAASKDGSTLVSYSADGFNFYGELYHYAAGIHPDGTLRDIYDWDTGRFLGKIKEAHETYNVVGNMNEFQVTITESTFGGRKELVDSLGIMDYGSLMYVALQRSHTAREAIKVMTSLVTEYGYYGSGESFTIADPDEVWVMEMIGKGPAMHGAVWVAVRIPDDCIAAHSNCSRIHQFPLDDPENCMYSADVISYARSKDYFNGINKDFSFADAYCPLNFQLRRFCEARTWQFFNKFTDKGLEYLPYIQGTSDVAMPLYMKPNRKLSVEDMKNALRDHYENTPLDSRNDDAAGPFHSPYRQWPLEYTVDGKQYFNERAVSVQGVGFVLVAQMRVDKPDAVGGLQWFGVDDADCSVFTPIYCCTDTVPPCLAHITDELTFNWNSSFWVFNWLANMVYPYYGLMIGDLRSKQSEMENRFDHQHDSIEAVAVELSKTDAMAAKKILTKYSLACAQNTHNEWRKFGEFMFVKYFDGVVRRERSRKFLRDKWKMQLPEKNGGYPDDFLKQHIKNTGDRYLVPVQ